jgi:cytochrome c peroxidase
MSRGSNQARVGCDSRASLRALALVAAGIGLVVTARAQAQGQVTYTESEIRRLLQHSPLDGPPVDPTNRVADDARAARLGQRLFFDRRLSGNGELSCATCHAPEKCFADGKQLAQGIGTAKRHAPSLYNVAWQRWFFWDGRIDTLWGQAMQPLEDPNELGSSRTALARTLANDTELRAEFEAIFGALSPQLDAATLPEQARPVAGDAEHPHARAWEALGAERRAAVEAVAVNALKSIAAYERRLVSRGAPFDVFVEGLRENDPNKLAALSPAAQRGARLFVGRADCRSCHSGSLFSDGEFHDLMLPPLGGGRPSDPGRYTGIERLLADPLRSAGPFSDAPDGERARTLERLARGPETYAQLRTPSLRNVARTAPYMHQGQFATLHDVLHFYSTLEGQVPTGHHEETILKPLQLTPEEQADLEAFLESLTDESLDPALLAPLP